MPRNVVPILSPPTLSAFCARSSAICQGNTTCARSLIINRSATGMPRDAKPSISCRTIGGLNTTPGVITFITPSVRIPLGIWCSL